MAAGIIAAPRPRPPSPWCRCRRERGSIASGRSSAMTEAPGAVPSSPSAAHVAEHGADLGARRRWPRRCRGSRFTWPTKLRDPGVCRPLVDAVGRADLGDAAAEHHHDAVGHGHRLGLVMGDVDGGDADAPLQVADEDPHLLAQLGVEIGERLVEQQDLRLDHQRAGQRDALLLAAGKLARIALGHSRASCTISSTSAMRVAISASAHLAHLQPEGEVLLHGHMREQGVVLEHHADVALLGRHVDDIRAVEADRCRRSASSKPAISFSVVVLPQPDGPEQRDELALGDRHRDAVDRGPRRGLGQLSMLTSVMNCHVPCVELNGRKDPPQ